MSLRPDTPLQYLKGVGPKLGDLLRKKSLVTVQDLLEYYPRAYQDRRAARDLKSLVPGELVSVPAEIVGVRSHRLGKSSKRIFNVLVRDVSGFVNCKFFRAPYRGYFEQFETGAKVQVTGKVTEYRGQIEFHHPELILTTENETPQDAIIPLYPETEGLTSKKVGKLIETAFRELSGTAGDFSFPIKDPLPEWVRKRHGLPDLKSTLISLHFPQIEESEEFLKLKSPYHRRVVFEEFFWLELLLAYRRRQIRKESAPVLKQQPEAVRALLARLGFELTEDQIKSLDDIYRDLISGHPMHRMVQGDVGAGKTIVALVCALTAIGNGYQAALMAPTEILAEQHLKTAQKWLEPLGIKIALLKGSMKESERRQALEQIESGEAQFVLGTHALIQDGVKFANLGFVVIDEQHRFGVHQRLSLKQKGSSPHLLLLTATPIPRTLAMTVYGDLDVSIIRQKPAGRLPVKTRVTFAGKRVQVLDFLKKQLEKGRQAYVVYPLVEESEKLDLKNAITEHTQLSEDLKPFKVGLVHGRMKPAEKDEVMEQFRTGRIHVLVSTTVVEVGVDVANATMMVIENAERFGLSQLHQLRGRVGRSSLQSYCILVMGKAFSQESLERVRIMESTNDGFEVSERDLELRGPGEFLGERQSGLPGFKLADLIGDQDILKEARETAFQLMKEDPSFQKPGHGLLRERLMETSKLLAVKWVG